MKRILLLIFLVVALWLGVKITEDPGYILIAYQQWTIEMPVWLGVALVGLTFLILYGLCRLFYHLKRTGKYWQFWSKKWCSHRDSRAQIKREAYLALLKTSPIEANIWRTLPRYIQRDPKFIYCYAEKLCETNQSSYAEVIIRKYLKRTWSEPLIELYGKTVTEKPAEQLRFAERFLKQYHENPLLFLCLGRLAMHARLWGKAKHYVEMSVKQAPCVEGYEILGQISELLGDKEAAFSLYRKALQRE